MASETIIDVPVICEVVTRAQGSRRDRKTLASGMAHVTVKTVPRNDLEPVAEIAPQWGDAKIWYGHAGRLFEESPFRVKGIKHIGEPLNPFHDPRTPEETRIIRGTGKTRVVSDGYAEAAASAQRAADRLLLVGDRLMRESPGPAVWAVPPSRDSKRGTPNRIAAGSLQDCEEPWLAVGLKDLDWFDRVGRGLIKGRVEPFPGRITVHRPDLLALDLDGWSLVQTADLLLGDKLANRAVRNLTIPHVEALIGYRRPDFDRGTASEEMAELVALALSERRDQKPGNANDLIHEKALDAAELGLARWRERGNALALERAPACP